MRYERLFVELSEVMHGLIEFDYQKSSKKR